MKKLLLLLLLPLCANAAGVYEARYGVATTFNFELYNTDGTLDVDEVDGGTEVSVACDEGAETTATNDFVDEGTFYSIALTAAEMQCARIAVVIAATDTNVFFIQTHCHPSSSFPGRDCVIESGAAQSGSTTTFVGPAAWAYADDFFNGYLVCFVDGTGTQQCSIITDYVGATDTATIDTVATAPASGTDFIIYYDPRVVVNNAAGVLEANVINIEGTDATTQIDARIDARLAAYDVATETNVDANGTAITTVDTVVDSILVDTTAILADTGTDGVALSSDAQDALYALSGTADSGSTTTLVDAALTQADTDYWIGNRILFTDGTLDGETSCVTAFTPGSDQLTFSPAVTQAVSTHTYLLQADPSCADVVSILDDTGTSGVVLANDAITAAKIAADAIGASEIATDAIGAAELAADAIGASEVATDAIGAAELAADASTEIWAVSCEDQGSAYTCREVLSLVLAEAMGTAAYDPTTRTWTVSDPSGTEVRFTLVYGTDLDGDRDTSTPSPMTP